MFESDFKLSLQNYVIHTIKKEDTIGVTLTHFYQPWTLFIWGANPALAALVLAPGSGRRFSVHLTFSAYL